MTVARTEAQELLRHYFRQAIGDLQPDQLTEIADIVDQTIDAAVTQALVAFRKERPQAITRADTTVGPVLDLLQSDPHQWSTRPCPTCRSITAMVGAPFGCDLYAQQAGKERKATKS